MADGSHFCPCNRKTEEGEAESVRFDIQGFSDARAYESQSDAENRELYENDACRRVEISVPADGQ